MAQPFKPEFTGTDRLITLDFVRGFAVIAILWVNILSFAMPDAAFLSPHLRQPATSADEILWLGSFLLADGKFRGLFTLLFGASMMLIMDGAEAKGENATRLFQKRIFWLAIIGAAHYIFLWHGDILLSYAILGFFLIPMRRWRAENLLGWGIVAALIGALWMIWMAAGRNPILLEAIGFFPSHAAWLEAETMHRQDLASLNANSAQDLLVFSSSYAEILAYRMARFPEGIASVFVTGLETLPLMMMGAGLYRNGFLSGEWARADYGRFACWALPLGLILTGLPAGWIIVQDHDPMLVLTAHLGLTVPGRLLMILAYAALLIWWVKGRKMTIGRDLLSRFSAAGRMALSNYLASSIAMTSLFYGYGGRLYGQVNMWGLYGICALFSLLILLWSPLWLARFRYGPAEWMWRSLTRGTAQAMKK